MNLKAIKKNLNHALSIVIFGSLVNIPTTISAHEKVDWDLVKRGDECNLGSR